MIKRKFFMTFIVFFFLFPLQIAAETIEEPDVSSEAAILMDAKSGQVIYGKNEFVRMNPASITKIATAIYAIENGVLSDQVVVSEQATKVEGTTVYLEPGEIVSLEKLIIGMVVNSGNDAAIAIAEHIDGSLTNFEKNFNVYLQDYIGVSSTHFENPHGLYGENHYTTAYDMARITQHAMENEIFRSIFKIQEYEWDGESWDTTIVNHHRLVLGEFPYDAEITGGKNGFVSQSGFTLVTTATKGDLDLIAVTMKTNLKNEPYAETLSLFDYGFNNFKTEVIPKGSKFTVDNEEFVAEDDLIYTVNIHDKVSNKINPSGVLSIYNGENEQIASFNLKSLSAPVTKNITDENEENWQANGFLGTMELAILGVSAIIVVLVIQKLRKRA
ncbi:D-alanyl-D-alanine carboxypeptidase family protein [Pallidibacillus pasinlerensis]|uniref:D-alanyl-D-alanine carboxypeptidase n=1 Tax=Pallidibacillus pasinlerensis TaxID=2703818 RepID=A0ABX0A873_9BACI|nr:D-alanyl-D-alanine carboxypeptidase family protein [Pallidibacillus pasinlerensis]NCU17332.1 D-alanyl-D-alanine carboxypeptidase [Pallidibacillus pasinlerensis]